MNEKSKSRSPWGCLIGGCLVCVVLAVLGMIAIGMAGKNFVEGIEAQVKDPATRGKNAARALGAEILPEGYYPIVALRIPILGHFTLLGDQPPKEDGSPGGLEERGFAYLDFKMSKQDRRELDEIVRGETRSIGAFKQTNFDFDANELLATGVFEMTDGTLEWAAYTGAIRLDDDKPRQDALITFGTVDCGKDDGRGRFAVWIDPDPSQGVAVVAEEGVEVVEIETEATPELDLSGTAADSGVMAAFLDHLDLCPA